MRPEFAHRRTVLALTALAAAALLAACAGPSPMADKLAAARPASATAAATTVATTAPAPAPVPAPAPAPPPPPATAASAAAFTLEPPPAAALAPLKTAAATPLSALAPPASASPPPFAAVIRGARRIDGPLTLWQKDDKVWIELMPAQFGQPFLLSPKIKSGIGEGWVLGGLMALPVNGAGGPQIVEFVRVHNQIRLQARNTDVLAKPGSPEARALADGYSNSLMGAVPVISAPHPDRKSILIDAGSLFLNDLMGVGIMLQRNLRQNYGADRANSLITAVRSNEAATMIETQVHYFSPNPGAGGGPGPFGLVLASPVLPRFLPDTRSLLVGLHYALAPLPATPMTTRQADARLGFFTSTVLDFSDDLQASPRKRHVNRWRLDKQEPSAAMSEPVKPIKFWVDRNVPHAYREAVRAGILEWNRAFEKIGFQNAIVVEQQADDANFETLDFGHASVRWMLNADPVFGAIGPSHVDPRTGEILDADIAFEGLSARGVRSLRSQVLARPGAAASGGPAAGADRADRAGEPAELVPMSPPASIEAGGTRHAGHAAWCQHGAVAAEQLGYALEVMDARGEIDADGPVARQFVQDYVKDSIMHEVGHALGLRHNFRASRAYTEAQLADPEFTRANGTTGSVMEYNAVNLPSPGKTGGVPFQTALGPYDYWAIEYAYKPMAPDATPAAQAAELQRIAARSSEPLLAFGTDEDLAFGLDPETIQLDLGSDPVAFANKRLAIARDLFERQERRQLPPDRDYAVLRRSLGFALGDVTRALGVLALQLGGVATLRDHPGSGRDPLQPVPAAAQREALELMVQAVLAPSGLQISPALQRRLAPDYLDRAEAAGGPTDFALPRRLFELQRSVLAYLMSDFLAARMLDGGAKVDAGAPRLEWRDVAQRVQAEVWRELKSGSAVSAPRRELQREFLNRLAYALLATAPTARAEARGLARAQARALLAQLETAQQRARKQDAATREHLADSVATLRAALTAVLPRLAP